MPELPDVVRSRRMTRAFDPRPVPRPVLDELVDLASRAPSAGKTQGWHLIVLEGAETARFWDITLPPMRRGAFRWKRLLDAPIIAIPLADPRAYLERYSEDDKRASGLGSGTDAWPAPYWTIDTSMAVMTMLLAAEDAGLGALFFGIFRGERPLRKALGIPGVMQILGALALGYAAPPEAASAGDPTTPTPVADDPSAFGAGRSTARPRRRADEIIHRGGWRT